MSGKKILIIEDDRSLSNQLKWALQDEYEVFLAWDGDHLLETFQQARPNLILLDLCLPPYLDNTEKGLELLDMIIEAGYEGKVIVITGSPELKDALSAVERGVYDYYRKPIDMEELKILIRRALYLQSLEEESNKSRDEFWAKSSFENIIGNSLLMRNLYSTVKKVASTNATVLLEGESGTGKELIAQALHSHSPRKKGPFISINCAAIPEQLLESELFGHERGSFTGAYRRQHGKIELAHDGTLFLDEVGELSLSLQGKLLRFLQNFEIERIGSPDSTKVNVRVIAATNKNLQDALKSGNFREDLYYRLNVIAITLPPLRERGEDILLLAQYFLKSMAADKEKRIKGFSRAAREALLSYRWPGNVREMQNKIQRAIIISSGNLITEEDLGLGMKENIRVLKLKEVKQQTEKACIIEALEGCDYNISRASKLLGIDRKAMRRLIHKYAIQEEQRREVYK